MHPYRSRRGRRYHQCHALADPRQDDRPRPHRRDACKPRHRGRDRQARRPPEAPAGDDRAAFALRPAEDATALVMPAFEVGASDRLLAVLMKPHVLAAACKTTEIQLYIECAALKN
ncbi:hypothetical protein CUJ84_pRLN2000501 (plasmid) [Rhizobium leguminosarum]|uniref:Uncharacterized protein n=1 Tax=Rhizobium leguminosarum TaxID=384 RepID=A0A2K9ZFN4_RHILE|nr:hypothetical protein CUJ84_pRLN2000501 [Rhizobium leguminosarum]